MKNLPTRWWKDWGRKPDKRSIDEKPPNWWGRLGRKTEKSWWKNLSTWTKDRERKPRLVERGGVCSRRDLDNERLGQSKVLYSSSGVELLIVNYHAGSPTFFALGKQISGYPPASDSRTALTQTLPCHFFFIASLGASFSASRFLVRPVSCPCFRFRGSVGLAVGLAIGGMLLIAGKVTVGLSG